MGHDSINRSSEVNLSKLLANEQQESNVLAAARQEASEDSFQEFCSEAFNPWAADKDKQEKFKPLNDRKADAKEIAKEIQKTQESGKQEESANKYQKNNPELNARSLFQLLKSLNKNDSRQDLLKKVQDFFPDPSLADEALDYLIENTEEDLQQILKDTKQDFNKQFGRQIVAGKNIAEQARAFSQQGIGSSNSLKDLYRDITGNHKEPNQLFRELSTTYTFEKLKTVIQFLLHSLGSDLKNKGPSIPRGELAMLFTEARTLQAILGVFRFFQSRMRILNQSYGQAGKSIPSGLNFETLAQAFMRLVDERYPSSPKILKTAEELALERDILAAIIIISQFRDAMRGVSPRVFKSLKDKDGLLEAIIKCLEELEEAKEEHENEDSDENH
jgi:type III secretion protein W